MPKTERALPQKTIKTIISDKLAEMPDTRAWYVNERGERELSFSMLSHNGEELNDAVRKLEGALRQVPGFKNVAADASIDRPELRVVPKFDVAARLGVAPSKIAETIRVATIGDIDANLAKFNAGDRLVPIRVQIDEDARTDMQRLQNLRVTNATNVAIPLAAVADVTFGRGPSSISRYDRERRAVIGVDLESRYAMSSARETFLKVVDEQKLPAERAPAAVRRRGDPGRGGDRLHDRHGHRTDDRVRRARAAVRQRGAADHHPAVAAPVVRRRRPGAAGHQQLGEHAGLHRPA